MRESDPQSSWWWIESCRPARGSPWLQSILTELNEKTETMLGLIEQDADSFAQRAEMYYKKRPELISIVEDFYRAFRSLAEQLDHVKSKSRTCLVTTFGTPSKIISSLDIANDSYHATYYPDEYEACYADENAESEVDDPEDQGEVRIDLKTKEEEFPVIVDTHEVLKSGEELEKLRQEFPVEEENADSDIDDPEDQDEVQLDCTTKEEEFSVTGDITNDEVLKSTPELERPRKVFTITAENAESDIEYLEDQDEVQLDYKIKEEEFPIMADTNDQVLKLRAELERSRAEFSITGENAESEIEYPENQNKVLVDYKTIEEEFPTTVETNDEVLKLKIELERLREENRIHQENLNQKDEEKKEVIRHLSLAVDVLKQENERMRKFIATQSPKKQSLTQLGKLKAAFGKLFSGTPRCQPVAAL